MALCVGVILTGIVVSLRTHPAELLTVADHVAQVSVTENAGVQPKQSPVVVHRRDVQAGRVAEDYVYGRGLHIGGAVKAVSQCVGATAGYNADRQRGARQPRVRVIRIDLLILRRSQYQPVEDLGECAVAANTHHRLKHAQRESNRERKSVDFCAHCA